LSQAIAGAKDVVDKTDIGTASLTAALSPVIVRYLENFHKALLVVRQVSDNIHKAGGVEEEGRLQHTGLLLLAACHQLKEEVDSLASAVYAKANALCSAEQLSTISSLEPATQVRDPTEHRLLHPRTHSTCPTCFLVLSFSRTLAAQSIH
jgi:hypothetical protein